jgi:hypothetical protein
VVRNTVPFVPDAYATVWLTALIPRSDAVVPLSSVTR